MNLFDIICTIIIGGAIISWFVFKKSLEKHDDD